MISLLRKKHFLDNITVKNGEKVTLRELQSIIGALDHCYIIPAGRVFLDVS